MEGYALPSVLFLVTILTLVAFSVLLLDCLQRQMALRQVARVKAEFAAQSGVARVLESDPSQQGPWEPFAERRFRFEDGSEASVRVQPWGVYHLAESRGFFRTSSELRLALLAEAPPEAFKQALVLSSNQHQLVLTGSARIIGDVSIGPGGVTTGSLHGYPTPQGLPLYGSVRSGSPAQLMGQLERAALRELRGYYEGLLAHQTPAGAVAVTLAPGEAISSVPDSVDIVYSAGVLQLPGAALIERKRPLSLVVSPGSVTIPPGSALRGPLMILAEDSVVVGSGVTVEHVVLSSTRAIAAVSSLLLSCQLLAPRIILDGKSAASYPSALVSIGMSGTELPHQTIQLKAGTRMEGFMFLDSPFGGDLIEIERGATLVGGVYSTGRATIDGTVEGSVLAADLYFYEAPTIYLGWLRSGVIDRRALPEGFLVPPLFAGTRPGAILEWL
jgi:hypothetical protein